MSLFSLIEQFLGLESCTEVNKIHEIMRIDLHWIAMSSLFILLATGLSAWKLYKSSATYAPRPAMENFHDLSATTIEGVTFHFNQLKGKRVLIVNTASRCGFTSQYADLEQLNKQYGGDGFVILGFPCNQFGFQEPGSSGEIATFCEKNYGVSFQMMEKVDVKGPKAHPVYQWLSEKSRNGVEDHKVAWNFHKFLVDEEGRLAASLRSGVSPLDAFVVDFAKR
ncbi:MAG: glutathione peroxidase [Flavobacteriales bacterium]